MIWLYQTIALFIAFGLNLLFGASGATQAIDRFGIRLISWLENAVYPEYPGQKTLIQRGLVFSLLLLIGSYVLLTAILAVLYHFIWPLAMVIEAFLLWQVIDLRHFGDRAEIVANDLKQADLFAARVHLSYISDAETAHMNEGDVIAATLETIEENTIERVVAPLFYLFFLGTPGAVVYRILRLLPERLPPELDRYRFFAKHPLAINQIIRFIPEKIGTAVLAHAATFFERGIGVFRRFRDGQTVMSNDIKRGVRASRLTAVFLIAISFVFKAAFVVVLRLTTSP